MNYPKSILLPLALILISFKNIESATPMIEQQKVANEIQQMIAYPEFAKDGRSVKNVEISFEIAEDSTIHLREVKGDHHRLNNYVKDSLEGKVIEISTANIERLIRTTLSFILL